MSDRAAFEKSYFERTGSRLYCEAEYRGWQAAVEHLKKNQKAVVYAEFWPDGALKGYNEHADELNDPKPLFLGPAVPESKNESDSKNSMGLTGLQKDAANLLFALHDAWPYVQQWCTIQSKKSRILKLIRQHGEFADFHQQSSEK